VEGDSGKIIEKIFSKVSNSKIFGLKNNSLSTYPNLPYMPTFLYIPSKQQEKIGTLKT